jgi:molybdopterin converting factor small subunit
MEISENSTLQELINAIQLPRAFIGFIAVNERKQSISYQLQDQDEVMIFPHVSGG